MLDRTASHLRLQSATPAPSQEGSAGQPDSSSRSPTNDDGKVGRRIKEIRRNRGLTQKQVAGRVGVTGAQFHRYEVGATRIAASRLIAIAAVLQVRPEVLMTEAPARHPATFPAAAPPPTGDLVELVELFSSLMDERRRGAVLNFARSIATRPEAAGGEEALFPA